MSAATNIEYSKSGATAIESPPAQFRLLADIVSNLNSDTARYMELQTDLLQRLVHIKRCVTEKDTDEMYAMLLKKMYAAHKVTKELVSLEIFAVNIVQEVFVRLDQSNVTDSSRADFL